MFLFSQRFCWAWPPPRVAARPPETIYNNKKVFPTLQVGVVRLYIKSSAFLLLLLLLLPGGGPDFWKKIVFCLGGNFDFLGPAPVLGVLNIALLIPEVW